MWFWAKNILLTDYLWNFGKAVSGIEVGMYGLTLAKLNFDESSIMSHKNKSSSCARIWIILFFFEIVSLQVYTIYNFRWIRSHMVSWFFGGHVVKLDRYRGIWLDNDTKINLRLQERTRRIIARVQLCICRHIIGQSVLIELNSHERNRRNVLDCNLAPPSGQTGQACAIRGAEGEKV